MTTTTDPTNVWETITPAQALEYLGLNFDRNRRVKQRNVQKFARDMRSGAWRLTGESIKFDTDGRLVDGQNRLHAIVAADVPVRMAVTYGVEPEVVVVLDSGAARNAADSLTISGTVSGSLAKDVGAVARLHLAWEAGEVTRAEQRLPDAAASITNTELARYVEDNPFLIHATRYVQATKRVLHFPVGPLAVGYIETARVDEEDANLFIHKIRDGIRLGTGDPIQTLEKRVTEDRFNKDRIQPGTALYYYFRTWNAFRSGEQLKKLQTGSAVSGYTEIPKPR